MSSASPLRRFLVVGLNNGSVDAFELATASLMSSHECHSKGVKSMVMWNDEKILVNIFENIFEMLKVVNCAESNITIATLPN